MSEEKEFNELCNEIYADIAVQFGAGDYIEGDDREFLAKQIVKHLQEWGYRKADEVRKETAGQIKRYIKNNLPLDSNSREILDEICEEFGVEEE